MDEIFVGATLGVVIPMHAYSIIGISMTISENANHCKKECSIRR